MSNTTKRALAESLKKLLSAKTLDKITVSDIVEDCGVNRQTFYYHFHDIYDLVEWIFEDDAARITESWNDSTSWQELFRGVFSYLTDNAPLVLNAYHSAGWGYVSGYLRRRLRPLLESAARGFTRNMQVDEEDLRFVVNIYQSAVVGVVDDWLDHDMRTEYSSDVDRLIVIVDGSMEHTLSKFDRKNAAR